MTLTKAVVALTVNMEAIQQISVRKVVVFSLFFFLCKILSVRAWFCLTMQNLICAQLIVTQVSRASA